MSGATQGPETGAAATSAAAGATSAAGSATGTAGTSTAGAKASSTTAGSSAAAAGRGNAAAGSGNASAGQSASGGDGAAAGSGSNAPAAGTGNASGGAGAGAAADGGGGSGIATAGSSASAGAGAGTAGAGAANGGGRMPDPKFLVAATGPCPDFKDGYVMFAPDGKQRRVLLYTSGPSDKHGPLLFSWHSTLPNPEDAVSWIGQSVINEIKAQGGVVAAPATGYPGETRPWDNTPMGAQNVDGDQRLMDEVVACAIMKLGIDVRRIHATGMSAGGLKTSDVSFRRSGYLASVVVYSGGFVEGQMPPDQDATNPVNAMIFYGGPTDISPVDGINYTQASNRYLDATRKRGGFAFLCNHGGGHSVPRDSQAGAWKFLQDHPFGTKPSPYEMQLPSVLPRYCMLPN